MYKYEQITKEQAEREYREEKNANASTSADSILAKSKYWRWFTSWGCTSVGLFIIVGSSIAYFFLEGGDHLHPRSIIVFVMAIFFLLRGLAGFARIKADKRELE